MGQCPVFTGIASALQKYQFDPYLWRVCAWVVQILQVFSLEPNHAWFVIVIHTKLTSGRFHIIRHCEGLVSSIYTTFAQRTLTAGSDDMLTCDTVDLKQLNRFTPCHRRRLTLNYEGGTECCFQQWNLRKLPSTLSSEAFVSSSLSCSTRVCCSWRHKAVPVHRPDNLLSALAAPQTSVKTARKQRVFMSTMGGGTKTDNVNAARNKQIIFLSVTITNGRPT